MVIVGVQRPRSAGLTATECCSTYLLESSAAFVRSVMLVALLNIFIGIEYSVEHRNCLRHSVHCHGVPCLCRERVNDRRRNGTKVLLPRMLQCRPAKCVHQKCLHQTIADQGVDILSPREMCPVLFLSRYVCCSLLRFGEMFSPTLYEHYKHLSVFTTHLC